MEEYLPLSVTRPRPQGIPLLVDCDPLVRGITLAWARQYRGKGGPTSDDQDWDGV